MIFLPDQAGWTITTKLGHILTEAEHLYGARDRSYTILGVEITKEDYASIWFPGDCKHISIKLSVCKCDMNQAVFQLAHEVIHCLFPTGTSNVNFLEEGLATYFSIEYTRRNGHGDWNRGLGKYEIPLQLVNELFAIDPDIIKKVRAIQPTLSLVTSTDLMNANNKIPSDLADKLVQKF